MRQYSSRKGHRRRSVEVPIQLAAKAITTIKLMRPGSSPTLASNAQRGRRKGHDPT